MNFDKSLPEMCFSFLYTNPPGKQIICIQRGESGYCPTTYDEADPEKAKALVDHLNTSKLQVTKEERECMEIGSMFGWDSPGAILKKSQSYVGVFLMEYSERDQEFEHTITFMIRDNKDPNKAMEMIGRELDETHRGFKFTPKSVSAISSQEYIFLRDKTGSLIFGYLNMPEDAPAEESVESPSM